MPRASPDYYVLFDFSFTAELLGVERVMCRERNTQARTGNNMTFYVPFPL